MEWARPTCLLSLAPVVAACSACTSGKHCRSPPKRRSWAWPCRCIQVPGHAWPANSDYPTDSNQAPSPLTVFVRSCLHLWQSCRRGSRSRRELCEVCGQRYTLPAGYRGAVETLVAAGELEPPRGPAQRLVEGVQGAFEPLWLCIKLWFEQCAHDLAACEQAGREWALAVQRALAEWTAAPAAAVAPSRTAADWATEAAKHNLALEAELWRLLTVQA
jgi:hypothetical protein